MKIISLCLFVAVVLGQNSTHEEMFKSLDLNGDGVVVYQELLSDFLEKDTNGDRQVSLEEFAAKSFVGSIPIFVDCTFNYYDKMDGKKDGIMEEISTNITYSILDPDNDGEITFEDFEINVGQIENGIIAEMMALLEQGSY
ncbi:calcium-binding protein-like [Pomacea canaliculata]|uniref:calcium-binding protein-like n=1 Tax=Pomacea canaliculata TaxID=400727 RepID=UPI000D73FC5B|nr:calcium-binding protein-like [Pomacea canaliculata]